jgi:hypothetical protein
MEHGNSHAQNPLLPSGAWASYNTQTDSVHASRRQAGPDAESARRRRMSKTRVKRPHDVSVCCTSDQVNVCDCLHVPVASDGRSS